MYLESFFESYGLIIILLVAFALIMLYYFFRNKKFQQTENEFHTSLKVGDKVKTYSGFYGTVEKITETTDGKVVTLKLGKNTFIDVDIRALMGIDYKEEIKETPVEKVESEKVEEEKVEENIEPQKVEETEVEKADVEDKAEIKEEKPAKKTNKKSK